MSMALSLSLVAIVTFLAFWRANAVLFMIAAGVSVVLGLTWYDTYGTNIGLTCSLMLIAYTFYCLGMAFRMLFWRDNS